jgi:hypothetical protein
MHSFFFSMSFGAMGACHRRRIGASPCVWPSTNKIDLQAGNASKRNGAPGAQRLNQLEKKETERSFVRQLREGSRLRYDSQSGAKERTCRHGAGG